MEFRLFLGLFAALSSILLIANLAEAVPDTSGGRYQLTHETYDSFWKLRQPPDPESESYMNHLKSIEDFGQILKSVFDDDACKQESLELIYIYHLEYLKPTNWRKKIPRNIRAYFIKLVQTIAGLCLRESESVMSTPEWESQKLPPSEFDLQVLRLAFDNDKFKRFFHDFSELETIDLPKPRKVLLPENSVFRQAQEICESRLRPVYEHLIVPSLRLILAGHGMVPTVYNIHLFKEIEGYRHETILMERWHHIVQVCEVLKNLDFYIIPKDKKDKDMEWGSLSDADAEKVANLRVDDSDKNLKMIDVSNLKGKKVKISRSIWDEPDLEMMIAMFERMETFFRDKSIEIEEQKLKRHENLIDQFLNGIVAFSG